MPPNTTNQPPEPGSLIRGSDPPPGPATAGYKLNHLMLRIRSPARSLHFYKDLLGLRSIFTMNAGPFTMYYLAIRLPTLPQRTQAKENLQAWAVQTSNIHALTQIAGLLELYHIHGTEEDCEGRGLELSTGNEPPALGFGHVGFSVPDVGAAVERLRGAGVRVFKEVGETGKETVPISGWEEARGVGTGELHGAYQRFWGQIAYVLDPDGYFVELVPQNMQ
ncbi:lactoylglutathione lyase Glo1 [Aspergillus sp. HF37]|nr:lactoylglutathione lyase Glo1 [Aspergillus sp. HF37]